MWRCASRCRLCYPTMLGLLLPALSCQAVDRPLQAAEETGKVRVVPIKRDIERRVIFNGEDLSGWTVLGANRWAVEDGELVGTGAEDSPGWILFQVEERETTLSLQFRIEDGAHSAVAVRVPSETRARGTGPDAARSSSLLSLGGFEAKIAPVGAEQEPTGTIIGLCRAYPASPTRDGAPFLFPNAWNQLIVSASRNLVRVSLNGYVVADAFDDAVVEGSIALHLPEGRGTIRFRDIILATEHILPNILAAISRKPTIEQAIASSKQASVALFTGDGLDLASSAFQLREGCLVCRSAMARPTPYVLSRDEYTSFLLGFEVLLDERSEAMVAWGIRGGNEEGPQSAVPYELALNCQTSTSARHPGGSVCDLARAYAGAMKANQWNRCEIYRLGNEMAVYINGGRAVYLLNRFRASKTANGPPLPKRAYKGRIGFRILAGDARFRTIQVKPYGAEAVKVKPTVEDGRGLQGLRAHRGVGVSAVGILAAVPYERRRT
ncbi:MAG: DUF1080 domain-containing protein [Planctomycetes bacterium]|nr:DUF1080 domain-containing protein [Planctomycetota bacterium]